LKVAGGGDLKNLGVTKLTMTLPGGVKTDLEAVVTPQSHQLLLGMPYLKRHTATILAHTGWMKLGGIWYCTQPHRTRYQMGEIGSEYAEINQVTAEEHQELEQMTKGTVLSKEQIEEFQRIMLKHEDVWAGERLGRSRNNHHTIELADPNRVTSQRAYRVPPEKQLIIDAEIEKMLKLGVIRRSKSPFASPVVLVQKKQGDWRFCVDFRRLNTNTKPDAQPIPIIKDLFNEIKDSKYFISLDLRAGYWQIPMADVDTPKTAFITQQGLYEYVVMPFGLTNAPATFQRMMNKLFGHLSRRGVLVYLDDVVIHSQAIGETL